MECFRVFLIKRIKCVTDIGEATWTVSSWNDLSGTFMEQRSSVTSVKCY